MTGAGATYTGAGAYTTGGGAWYTTVGAACTTGAAGTVGATYTGAAGATYTGGPTDTRAESGTLTYIPPAEAVCMPSTVTAAILKIVNVIFFIVKPLLN